MKKGKKTEEKKAPDKEKKKEKWEKITRQKITVDFWRTSLHGKKIGIRQKEQLMAKSRQFSKDMDIYGQVKFGNEDAGNIGLRTTEWTDADVENGQLKRLVVRFFNEQDRWVASIEEDTIRGLTLSAAYEEAVPVFNVFMSGTTNVFTLERIERHAGTVDRVAIPLVLDKDGKTVDLILFDKRRLTMGDDWQVYRAGEKERTLADLDSKKLNIGGKVEINIYDPELVTNNIFVNTLIMFASITKFWDELKDSLNDSYKQYMKENFVFKPNRHELELLENPRRFAR